VSRHNKERRDRRRDYRIEVLRQARAAMAAGSLQRGRVYEVTVFHDEWCRFPGGRGPCTCNPEVGPPVPLDPAPGGSK
jgi:hypothetical protein